MTGAAVDRFQGLAEEDGMLFEKSAAESNSGGNFLINDNGGFPIPKNRLGINMDA